MLKNIKFSDSQHATNIKSKSKGRREFEGKITHIFSNHGLIDNEVYFSFDDVLGRVRPNLNDIVTVVAKQQYENGGWHAEQVSVSENWDDCQTDDDDTEKELYPTEIVGHVTDLNDSQGYVGGNVYFDLKECKCDDYKPFNGDWVKVSVIYPEGNSFHAVASELQPLRVKETDGVISGEMGDHGYIDGEVFYMSDAIVDGFIPRKWDPVHYRAVESLQGRSSWRAVEVKPSDKPQYAK